MILKLCIDCLWSRKIDNKNFDGGSLMCIHPKIIASEARYLSLGKRNIGPYCSDIRGKEWPFAKCGIKGKLWDYKSEIKEKEESLSHSWDNNIRESHSYDERNSYNESHSFDNEDKK